MTERPAIQLKNAMFRYSSADQPLLEIKSFSVDSGEKVFLRGPSGSGKTTLLGLIAGLHQVNQGEVLVLGHDLAKLSGAARDRFRGKNLGYIFQMFNLIPYLSVLENVLVQVGLSGRMTAQTVGQAQDLLSQLGMSQWAKESVSRLSVGQQQRVAAARALVGNPGLLIADEPTSALDYDARDAFLDTLFSLCTKLKTTLLFVSHDPSLQKHFDRVVELSSINSAQPPSGRVS